jgi:hypothetical protein
VILELIAFGYRGEAHVNGKGRAGHFGHSTFCSGSRCGLVVLLHLDALAGSA